jgi:glycosyltransferase involved in cell wall biosynthesis
MARVLFYCDVGGFGGHEIMAILIMKELIANGIEVHFACGKKNDRLLAEAAQVKGLNVHTLHFSLNRFSFLTNTLDLPKSAYLRRLIRGLAPHCIVAVQGTMEISSLILLAAKRERTPVVTYIALAQSMKSLGLSYPWLRDALVRFYFTLPDRFITIGESQKRHLLSHGVPAKKISVVPNVVPFHISRNFDKNQARKELGLDRDKTWFGLVGRVFAYHKGHDYLVSVVRAYKECFSAIRFLIVGDGPDLGRIKEMVNREGLGSFFSFNPWTGEMNLVYSALDAVIMPSNHEGVPLVMIEAGLFGLPVVASAIDGMKDYLPDEWLFPRGDLQRICDRIRFIATNDQSELCAETRQRFSAIFQRTTIGEEFLAGLRLVNKREPTGEREISWN